MMVLVDTNVLATNVCTRALTREVDSRLLAQALQTARQFEISAYDARFVTRSKQMRVKLVTEDTRLRAAVPNWTVSLAGAPG